MTLKYNEETVAVRNYVRGIAYESNIVSGGKGDKDLQNGKGNSEIDVAD